MIRSTEPGQAACTASDVEGATHEAAQRGEPFLHLCHAGLMEVVLPVVYRGEQVATVFCGQAVVEACPAADPDWLARRAQELGIDPDRAAAACRALPRISEGKLAQIGRLLFLALSTLAEHESRAALERALALERSRAVRDALAYLDQHFQEPARIADIAARVGLTSAYFSRHFRKVVGVTFVDYLTRRRIEEAKELLKRTNMKVLDIAFAVGYEDQSYFGRKFRQVTGQTPSAFRKANWVGDAPATARGRPKSPVRRRGASGQACTREPRGAE